jgi:hypothetical protein
MEILLGTIASIATMALGGFMMSEGSTSSRTNMAGAIPIGYLILMAGFFGLCLSLGPTINALFLR